MTVLLSEPIESLWKHVEDFVGRETLCSVSYINLRGVPSAALIAYFELSSDPAFLFHASSDSRKAQAISRNPAVAIVIGPGFGQDRTLQVEGEAYRTKKDEHRSAALDIGKRKKSPCGPEFLLDSRSLLFIVHVNWMRYSGPDQRSQELSVREAFAEERFCLPPSRPLAW